MGSLVFGHPPTSARASLARFVGDVARHVGVEIDMHETASSYEELARAVHARNVHLAWLPPITFVALERQRAVVPLVGAERGNGLKFESVIVVHKRATFLRVRELHGKRAAWVDPFSASGYVFPRLELAAAGVAVDAFASETFYGTHAAAVRAVAMKNADFAGTFATLGQRDEVLRAAWLEDPEVASSVRVLAPLGSLPSDVIAARADVPAALQNRLGRALVAVSREPQNRRIVREVFGADELRQARPRGYEVLRAETERAAAAGLL